ncbi:MAG: hypothetical protein GX895_12145 [Clostridiales bacterium]|uniref:hypothetical protein n=1 Tax=Clostridium sp. N3C TaxID=1776758 RepID=UPI00092DF368|nr:hypothetical protein [Clostridium sp. N3C]NLZ49503.1 hypothetical protein [Clostridiales bacterium]SCN24718.1 hypothetical protein N3C_1944 [Clostridium sp. N3C]
MEFSFKSTKYNNTSQSKNSKETDIDQLVEFSDFLFFIGDAINVFTKSDRLSLLAANIKLVGGIFAIVAALWSASEDAKNKDLDPYNLSLDQQVILGAIISQIGALILTDALQKNIGLSEGTAAPPITPF